jgi:hypothetical protein
MFLLGEGVVCNNVWTKTVILTDFNQVSAYVLLNITESSGLQHGNCMKPLAGVPYFVVVVELP